MYSVRTPRKAEKPTCIIEFQAFRGNADEFIVKELVVLDVVKYIMYTFLFKPPHSFNKLDTKAKITNKWMSKHLHRIKWNEGHVDYESLNNILYYFCSKFDTIYTRGSEKCKWLQMYTRSRVYDITVDKGYDVRHCRLCECVNDKRHAKTHCAMRNAFRLAAFLELNTKQSGRGTVVSINTGSEGAPYTSIALDSEAVTSYNDNMTSQQFLQSLAQQFNAQSKSGVLPTRKCSELKEQKHYIVHTMRRIDTTVGDAIIVSLSDAPYTSGDEAKFQVFLPKRFVHVLQNEELRNIEPGSLYLVSHGTSGTNSTELSLHVASNKN